MLKRALSVQESWIQRRVDRRGAALETVVVFLCGVLGSAGVAYFALQMWDAVESPLPYTNYTLVGEAIAPIALVFGVWLLYTVATHFLANFSGGRGPVSRLFRVAGWAVVPIGIWLLLRSIVVVVLFSDVDIPASPDGISPQVQVQNVMEMGLESPAYFATFVVGILFVVWSWHLLAVGVAKAKDVPLDDARKIAAGPAAVVALYLLRTGLQWWAPF